MRLPLLLGITRLALWWEDESLATLGLGVDSRRLREFGYGVAICLVRPGRARTCGHDRRSVALRRR